MDIKELIKNRIVVLDGGMGTKLQAKGLKAGELPELWNLTHSDDITEIHRQYLEAGSDIITANTFGLNRFKYNHEDMEKICFAAISNARKAGAKIVAYDMGPSGRMLKPWGDLPFEDAVDVFKEQTILAVKAGADMVIIETMADSYETKAALLAVKENSDLPVFVSNAYGADGKLLTGASPAVMTAMLEGLGADAFGANCSLGPKQLVPIMEEIARNASIPVFVQPNAGLPVIRDGKTEYDVSPDEFAEVTASMVDFGVGILGGCCGTTPEHIAKLCAALKTKKFIKPAEKDITVASSYAKTVEIGKEKRTVVIGERINPSGNKKLKEAILSDDTDFILRLGLEQEEAGSDVLDVNMGLPGTDEVNNLKKIVSEMQSVTTLPLQLDSSNPKALEEALRVYNGKALINSVNGKEESLKAVLPLAKKYGGVLVCLCLDDSGIPETAEGRFAVAEKIVKAAESYGISRKNLIFDALTMPVSANKASAKETLRTMRLIREKLGCGTILGVSNVSFGLPERAKLNAAFLTLAMYEGLSAGIINPLSKEIMAAYESFGALMGYDNGFDDYIAFMDKEKVGGLEAKPSVSNEKEYSIGESIIKGLGDQAQLKTKTEILKRDGLEIINEEIIPALDFVGKSFEEGKMYLPQLLLSAEAANKVFAVIKENNKAHESGCSCEACGSAKENEKFVLATVKGDIHDIGKNIVKLLLGNYGFDVIDLGKDVPPEDIVNAVIKHNSRFCGLSALMTTTVPAMEETIRLLRTKCPDCIICVGGAVLTEDYAKKIGADFYGKDAMATVKFAKNK